MTMTPSKIYDAGYYEELASEGYYEAGGEPSGYFLGSGAKALSLNGVIQGGQLKLMLEGFHPATEKPLSSNVGEGHRAGYDLSFSAPKSVSTVWASTQDEYLRNAIQQAQQEAVERAIKYIEESGIAEVRRGHNGVERNPAKLIAAGYEHGTSRTWDPQLHTHTLIASHGIDVSDGSIKSLESQKFWAHQKEIGAVYRAELAEAMKELGFSIEREGQAFRLIGSNEGLEKEWSKRREMIEKRMDETGYHSAKAAEIANLDTRQAKGYINRSELMETWKEDAIRHEFDVESIRGMDKTNLVFDPKEALQSLTELQAVFTETNLKAAIMQGLQGIGTADDLDDSIEDLVADGELILLGKNHAGMLQMTTREMLKLEEMAVCFAKENQNDDSHDVSNEAIENAISNKEGISEEQQQALRHICDGGQVVSVTGAAGTGKSFMLAAAKDVYQAEGFNVIGCSLSGKAAAELESGSGIKSQTIHSLVIELENAKRQLSSKDILVMDEAGMTDTRLMSRVIEQVDKAGAKLILVGDTQQLQSIGAGGVFGKISHEIGSAEILTVRRQQVEWQKAAAMDIRSGHSVQALKAFNEHDRLIISKSNSEAHQSVVEAWKQADSDISEKLMIAGKRVDVASLNREARVQLQASGRLKGEVPVSLKDSVTAQVRTLNLANGDRLRLTKNDKSMEVKNGDLATVKRLEFTKCGLRIHIELDRGGSRIINPESYSNMMHGYAITAHASQGATVDRAFFYTSSFNSKELAYVAASRHRHDVFIFGSKEELGAEPVKRLEESFSRINEKVTALEIFEAQEKQETVDVQSREFDLLQGSEPYEGEYELD